MADNQPEQVDWNSVKPGTPVELLTYHGTMRRRFVALHDREFAAVGCFSCHCEWTVPVAELRPATPTLAERFAALPEELQKQAWERPYICWHGYSWFPYDSIPRPVCLNGIEFGEAESILSAAELIAAHAAAQGGG